MDMFSGVNGEIVMDVKDYIREKCGSNISDHIDFYINFYNAVLDYSNVTDFENDNDIIDFAWAVESEL